VCEICDSQSTKQHECVLCGRMFCLDCGLLKKSENEMVEDGWMCYACDDIPDGAIESAMQNVVKPLLIATQYPRGKRLDRDVLGRVVRSAWIEWAGQQPNPKSSWLVPYDELDEPDKEADRLIGERVAQYVKIVLKTELRDLERLAELDKDP
jgi:hypothetical protein